ncbi:hypothetical protein UPYG_G00116920 [Umbra pygmaea]|uniref:Rho-GAP domain-containing protein n=1 Tax=Umbra pygmaea TaxID=75934 RepID=A0ABD0X4C4_UMBPY
MPKPMDDRLRVVAVIHALKASGIRVKNRKNFLNGPYTSDPVKQENQCVFAFGRDLTLLPQCDIREMSGTVPKFLVDCCVFLTQHLHTEGLFRKTGSLSRIRALRADLEQGSPVFSLLRSATLQPCDVASLVKQFLRELPSPLIPLDLQVPMCHALGLEEEAGQEQGPDGATLLLTALFPPCHARTLRYFCTFLRQVAERSEENRMEVSNLALVIAPNLLHCPAGGFKLTAGTEKQLDRQAAVIKTLIVHADRIGFVPPSVMDMATVAESGELSTPPADQARFQERGAFGVYRSLRRQRRRSVGEIFVDALSKFKTSRAYTGSSLPTETQHNTKTVPPTTHQSPVTSKRKSSEDPVSDLEGSAKKRRSIHDLREDNESITKPSDVDTEWLVDQSHNSVLRGVECSREHQPTITLSASEKKKELHKDQKASNKHPVQEDKTLRRRSLRFFNMTHWNVPNSSPLSIGNYTENWVMRGRLLTNGLKETSCSEVGPSRISVIMTDGPDRVLVEKEVEDDPDLLNYSFTEDPDDLLDVTILDSQDRSHAGETCDHSAVRVENETLERPVQDGTKKELVDLGLSKKQSKGDQSGHEGQKPRRPRRSISMPEVTLDQLRIPDEMYRSDKSDVLQEKDNDVLEENCFPGVMSLVGKGLGKGMDEAEELEDKPLVKKDKMTESGLAFKKTNQRMSVADHLRRFNTLAMLLRTPRVPPPTPEPQLNHVLHESQRVGGLRSVVRLRRQGARRFGRSISHDGVPGGLPEQASHLQNEPVVFQSSSDPIPCPQPEQNLFTKSLQQAEIKIQHAPDLQIEQDDFSQTVQDLRAPQSPNPKPCPGQFSNSQVHFREDELALLEGQPRESDLDELLNRHLNICCPEEEEPTDTLPLNGPSQTDAIFDDLLQNMKLQQEAENTEVQLPLPPTPPLSQTETCSPSLNEVFPRLLDRMSSDLYTAHLVTNYCPTSVIALDSLESDIGVSDRGSLLEISPPPALQFRLPATRRRYRDSPRWPINEISMATGDPLQI